MTTRISQSMVNEIAYSIVGCSIEIHKALGPGLLESIYHQCMMDEMTTMGLKFVSEFRIPIIYKEKLLPAFYKIDLVVEDLVIVELKSVEHMLPLFKAQLFTYLKLTGKPKGLLINFNCENIVRSLIPMVTDEYSRLPEK